MTITLLQLVVTVGLAVMVPTLTALIGILISNRRFDDLNKQMDEMLIGWEREKGGEQCSLGRRR